MDNLTGVIQLLKKEQDRLTRELRGVGAALAAFGKAYGTEMGTRKVSASARARMAAAQKARWAKAREDSGARKKGAGKVPKRVMSAAARKKIAAAQRARWTKVKAGKKTA
jgi:hypothetical protein